MKSGDLYFQVFPRIYWYIEMVDDLQPSCWTHVGIIYQADKWYKWLLGKWWGLESIPVFGTWTIPLWLVRLRCFWTKFEYRSLPGLPEGLVAQAMSDLGTPYDYNFKWTNGTLYCSELVFQAFAVCTGTPLCHPVTLGSLDPAGLTKWKSKIVSLQGGTYNPNLIIVTPKEIYEASIPQS